MLMVMTMQPNATVQLIDVFQWFLDNNGYLWQKKKAYQPLAEQSILVRILSELSFKYFPASHK